MSATPASPPPIRRLLAAALGVGIATVPNAHAGAQTADVPPHLRDDPARRIFPALGPARAGRAPHAIVPVTTCDDDGPGSLRDAVANAIDGDTIDLSALTCSVITLTTGAIEVDVATLTISGPGRTQLAIDGGRSDRVFIHPARGALTFQDLAIRNGLDVATGFDLAGGGCIASASAVYLVRSLVNDCGASGEGSYGGAIYAYSVTLDESVVTGNTADGTHPHAGTAAFGGAIFAYVVDLTSSTVSGNRAVHHNASGFSSYDIGGAMVTVVGGVIRSSTIANNVSQGRGGGIATFNPIVVVNSTLSGNVAQNGAGGGAFMRRPATISAFNTTVSDNRAVEGGGLWIAADGSELHSTLVWGNAAYGDTGFADVHGRSALSIGGDHNLVGSRGPAVSLPADTLAVDPLLVPLAVNGGPTRTHALAAGSPAIDAGSNANSATFDQRGDPFPRTYGAGTDIGAYEASPRAVGTLATPVPGPTRPVLGGCAVLLAAFALRLVARIQRRAQG